MYKRILLLAMFILMFVAVVPSFVKPNFACAATTDEIEIATLEDFMALPCGAMANYKLVNNLDFSEVASEYAPINFCGTLDGNGHAINNLNIVSESSAALFLSLENATILNLTINNIQVYSSASAAALAINIKNSTLNNVRLNLETCFIFGATSAGKLAVNISDSKFVDVIVSGGLINGAETDKLAQNVTNTTEEFSKHDEIDKEPEVPNNKDEENKTPTVPDNDTNNNESGDDLATDKDEDDEVKPPVESGDENNSAGGEGDLPSMSADKGDANLPTPNVPATTTPAPEVNGIVNIGDSSSQIVVNKVSLAKIIAICVLAAVVLAYGFIEVPLKNFIKKHLHKNR